jgi:outer membrane protein OmpA-like peptidoglycan-associated protein
MRSSSYFLGLLVGVSACLALPARASAAEAGFSFQASGSGANASASASGDGDDYWRRFRPTPMALELGLYGGLAIFSKQHNLQNLEILDETSAGHQSLKTGVDLGLRAGFYPLSFLGAEGELGVIPTKTGTTDDGATIWTYRLSAVAQYPAYRLVPFVLVGAGGMNLRSGTAALGKDSDPALHVGVGVKYAISQYLSARFDFRDNFMQENRENPVIEDGDLVQNFELLLGLSFTLGRTPAERAPMPVDSDRDGFFDPQDACPAQPGVAPNGCPAPAPPADSDKDGIPDPSDPCPTEAEDGAQPTPTDGCPNKDADGDGVLLPADLCPTVKGVAPDGCVHDKDADGIVDEVDKCPEQPETKNGFQDEDGCPDELPKEVAKFSGVIKGIQFDFGKATIRKESNKLLDEAVAVLKQYPDLRISISGHTDNVGDAQTNLELSQQRAAAVKDYLVGKGIDTGRIETRGAGANEPVADNATDKGRQENRRIEFKLLQK